MDRHDQILPGIGQNWAEVSRCGAKSASLGRPRPLRPANSGPSSAIMRAGIGPSWGDFHLFCADLRQIVRLSWSVFLANLASLWTMPVRFASHPACYSKPPGDSDMKTAPERLRTSAA